MGNKNKDRLKCFIYTRVSTRMQVDGYSLEAQERKLRKYAESREMEVLEPIFKDEGKSGKSTKDRDDFNKMMNAIKAGADVDYVLVFKLSRFGRNVADVLTAVQTMQDYGVELAVVEDGIDTGRSAGKLMLTILAAVAEVERENILAQTMAGREQKAVEGKWNGGFAPYGYKLITDEDDKGGKLVIEEDEAKVIRLIYEMYTSMNIGLSGIAKYLNTHGYKKVTRQNGTLDRFSSAFVKLVLDNPVYAGKIAYGRRRSEKINDGGRDYHIVKQKEFQVYDGIHDAIVSEEMWNLAHEKRQKTGRRSNRLYGQHINLLSGIMRCPICGGPLYGNVNRKKKKDGSLYKEYWFYACKHRLDIDGHKCTYRKQWRQEDANKEVLQIVSKVLTEDMLLDKMDSWFGSVREEDDIRKKIEDLSVEIINTDKRIRHLEDEQDNLPIDDDRIYVRKYSSLQRRIDAFYGQISDLDAEIENLEASITETGKYKLRNQVINAKEYLEQYKGLIANREFLDPGDGEEFGPEKVNLYASFEPQDRDLIQSIIEKVEIFEDRQEDGRLVKSIQFKVPIEYDGKVGDIISWDSESHVETVCLLSNRKPDARVKIDVDLEDYYRIKDEQKKNKASE